MKLASNAPQAYAFLPMTDMMHLLWTTSGVMSALYIAVAVMLLIVLYHVLFIVVDLRRVLRRVDSLTEQVELVLYKPLELTEKALEWMIDSVEQMHKKKKHKKK